MKAFSARFWRRVDQSGGQHACWPWLGPRGNGYGLFKITGVGGRSASRVALSLASGVPLTTEMHALHTCDNPPCCNPSHLYWGTAKQNAADRKARTRGWDRGRECHQFVDLTGRRFGRLVVLAFFAFAMTSRKNRRAHWRCRCDCGRECVKRTDRLRDTQSCGCLRIERVREAARNRKAVA